MMALPSAIAPDSIIASAVSSGNSSTSISSPSPSAATPPHAPTLSRSKCSPTKNYSFSVTEPGLMNASNTLRTFSIR